MKMYTYVNFADKCAEAFRFYERHLGEKITMMMTHGRQLRDRFGINWSIVHERPMPPRA